MKIHIPWLVLIVWAASVWGQNTNSPSRLLTLEGRVEVSRSGAVTWAAASTNQWLQNGDRVRTGSRSRATLQLSDRSVLRLNELTTMEVRPPQSAAAGASFEMKSGASYFFNRERPGTVEFRTPLASGAIRGTEFHLLVAENGRTEVALLDGLVDLDNPQGTAQLASGELGLVEPGQAPRKSALLDVASVIQWVLYYPAVVTLEELEFSPAEKDALAESLRAYQAGDLPAAQALYPEGRQPVGKAERVYRAATLLAVGQASASVSLVKGISSPAALALGQLIETAQGRPVSRGTNLATATGWMAESYALQAQSNLPEALAAARQAAKLAPSFGFAQVRVAELEFSFARSAPAQAALEQSLKLSPRNAQAHALHGYILAAQSRFAQAESSFELAIGLDPALGNAWLGRGLVRIRRGQGEAGRQDLQVATALEPRRSLMRSYLGKAWSHTRDVALAEKELRLARKLDEKDPTPWLYSALLAQQQNKVNEAVRDLERSQELNDNRSVFRSRLLLDQDQAVRSVNLARVYQDAGLGDWSVREAGRAVSYDYANYSAHQFLANSYDALRDPRQINLRYEAPAVSEYFIANLLAPVGATPLSQTVSAQEYTRLFERDHAGVASSTEYFSNGDWVQQGSQYGRLGNTDWSLEAYYRTENGQRKNNDVERTDYTAKVRQQLTAKDTLYFEAQRNQAEGGDLLQYYTQDIHDPYSRGPSASFRYQEDQDANLFAGYHREWSPASHTLFMAGRFEDVLRIQDPSRQFYFFRMIGGDVRGVQIVPNSVRYRTELEGYTAELQQILNLKSHTLIFGGRFQYAFSDTFNSVSNIARINVALNNRTYLDRESGYVYDHWMPWDRLRVTLGVSYDRLHYPDNIDTSPISDTESTRNQLSPKAGLELKIAERTYIRAAYTRSLGGVFFDNSLRLEPTAVRGFNQTFRSLASESIIGLVPATRFETFSLGLSHELETGTYLNADLEMLRSDARRTLGIITNSVFIPTPDSPGSTRQILDYEERALVLSANQLLGENWSVGMRYRLTDAEFSGRFPSVPADVATATGVNQEQDALLHQLTFQALFNHRSGFFAKGEALWVAQQNSGYSPALGASDFWQLNAFVGYRFWRRHAEATLGVLNLTDRDYKLNPLTLYSELPRERTFYASFKFYF